MKFQFISQNFSPGSSSSPHPRKVAATASSAGDSSLRLTSTRPTYETGALGDVYVSSLHRPSARHRDRRHRDGLVFLFIFLFIFVFFIFFFCFAMPRFLVTMTSTIEFDS